MICNIYVGNIQHANIYIYAQYINIYCDLTLHDVICQLHPSKSGIKNRRDERKKGKEGRKEKRREGGKRERGREGRKKGRESLLLSIQPLTPSQKH